jgi:large subunit ribosomal protein L31
MKADIHPAYSDVKATCSCGNVIETRSTLGEDLQLDVCSACHPFYTGKQKILDSGGRVERFRKRFGNRSVKRDDAAPEAAPAAAAEAPAAAQDDAS